MIRPSWFCGTPDCNESAALHSYGLDSHCRPVLRDPMTGIGVRFHHVFFDLYDVSLFLTNRSVPCRRLAPVKILTPVYNEEASRRHGVVVRPREASRRCAALYSYGLESHCRSVLRAPHDSPHASSASPAHAALAPPTRPAQPRSGTMHCCCRVENILVLLCGTLWL